VGVAGELDEAAEERRGPVAARGRVISAHLQGVRDGHGALRKQGQARQARGQCPHECQDVVVAPIEVRLLVSQDGGQLGSGQVFTAAVETTMVCGRPATQ
jgi:hypothetical protein